MVVDFVAQVGGDLHTRQGAGARPQPARESWHARPTRGAYDLPCTTLNRGLVCVAHALTSNQQILRCQHAYPAEHRRPRA